LTLAPVPQAFTLYQFHYNKWQRVIFTLIYIILVCNNRSFWGQDWSELENSCIKESNDVRVAQPGYSLGFCEQSVSPLAAQPGSAQNLHSHVALEQQIASPVDRTHSTLSDQSIYAVTIEDNFAQHSGILSWLPPFLAISGKKYFKLILRIITRTNPFFHSGPGR
jgi:hypothetical protein